MNGIKKFVKGFLKDEKGLGTVEMVILIAVLVAVALLFGKQIKTMVSNMLTKVDGKGNEALDEIGG